MTKAKYDNLLGAVYAYESELPDFAGLKALSNSQDSNKIANALTKWEFFTKYSEKCTSIEDVIAKRNTVYNDLFHYVSANSFVSFYLWYKLHFDEVRISVLEVIEKDENAEHVSHYLQSRGIDVNDFVEQLISSWNELVAQSTLFEKELYFDQLFINYVKNIKAEESEAEFKEAFVESLYSQLVNREILEKSDTYKDFLVRNKVEEFVKEDALEDFFRKKFSENSSSVQMLSFIHKLDLVVKNTAIMMTLEKAMWSKNMINYDWMSYEKDNSIN